MLQGIRRGRKAKARPHDVFQAGGQKARVVRTFLCRHGLRVGADCAIQVLCVRRKGFLNGRCIGFLVGPGDGCEGFGVFPISRRILDIKEIRDIPVFAGPTALTDEDRCRRCIRRNGGMQIALPEISRCHGGGPSWCVLVEVHLLVHRIAMEVRHSRQETLERTSIIAEFFFQSVILNEEIVLIRHTDSSFIVRLE